MLKMLHFRIRNNFFLMTITNFSIKQLQQLLNVIYLNYNNSITFTKTGTMFLYLILFCASRRYNIYIRYGITGSRRAIDNIMHYLKCTYTRIYYNSCSLQTIFEDPIIFFNYITWDRYLKMCLVKKYYLVF